MNVSEGRDADRIRQLEAAGRDSVLDVHSDAHHNRTVLTLGGPAVLQAVRDVTRAALSSIDIRKHSGVHPRLGTVDVVPFVSSESEGMASAIVARDEFA